MDMYWPAYTLIVSNVAREAKRVAHPWCTRIVDFIVKNVDTTIFCLIYLLKFSAIEFFKN